MEYLFDKHILAGRVNGVRYERANPSESYVEIPPAFVITDSAGGMWTLGSQYQFGRDGHLEFNVLRNDVDLGEMASRIVMRGGVVRIFGSAGWRTWNGRAFI